jgi:DNA-binding transcriptional MocR family regulator
MQAQISHAAATYTARRELFLACLARQGVEAHGASGLNVWVPVKDEAGTVGALTQRGWVVAPGDPYRLAGSSPGVRVTTATLAADEAVRLAGDIAEVLAPAGFSRSG